MSGFKINEKSLNEVLEEIKSLEKLLDERIVDLHQLVGAKHERHAFILYRDRLWNIRRLLREQAKRL